MVLSLSLMGGRKDHIRYTDMVWEDAFGHLFVCSKTVITTDIRAIYTYKLIDFTLANK